MILILMIMIPAVYSPKGSPSSFSSSVQSRWYTLEDDDDDHSVVIIRIPFLKDDSRCWWLLVGHSVSQSLVDDDDGLGCGSSREF